MNSYRFIAAVERDHPVARSRTVRKVARSGLYPWRRRERIGTTSARARGDATLTERITAIRRERAGTSGSPRVSAESRAQPGRCARKRAERPMRQTGLQGRRRPVRRARTTPADPTPPPATDLVRRAFAPADIGAPGRLRVADLTYVATNEGRLYRAAVPGAFGRRVVGWGMADHPRTDLALDALTTALQRRQPRAGSIHHRDHGRQHTAVASGARLRAAGPVASVGSVGDRFDNAVAESFFATRKVELPYRGEWPTRAAAESAIFRFIETWYNTRRRHSTLDYLSPAAFEEVQQQNAVA